MNVSEHHSSADDASSDDIEDIFDDALPEPASPGDVDDDNLDISNLPPPPPSPTKN